MTVLNAIKSLILPLFNQFELSPSNADKKRVICSEVHFQLHSRFIWSTATRLPLEQRFYWVTCTQTLSLVSDIISKLNPYNVCGWDEILKKFSPDLSILYKKYFAAACFMACSNSFTLFPVLKNSKYASQIIALLGSYLFSTKVLDATINAKFYLAQPPFGFRFVRSITKFVYQAGDKKSENRAVSQRLSTGLLCNFKGYGATGRIFGIIHTFQTNHIMIVVLNRQISRSFHTNAGIAGARLSLDLWCFSSSPMISISIISSQLDILLMTRSYRIHIAHL